MIEVRFGTDRNKRVHRVIIEGHAGLSSKGTDVLCAAVSALSYALTDGIIDVLGKEARKGQKEGEFFLQLESDGDDRTEIVFATVLQTLKKLADQYPDRMKIRREEDGA